MSFKLNEEFVNDHVGPHLRSSRIAVMLLGKPGIGKTSAIEGLTTNPSLGMKVKVFPIEVNTLSDAADLTGVRTLPDPKNPSEYVQVFFPHATLKAANEYALAHNDEIVVVILDEINRTTSDVTSAALTLVTARRSGNMDFAPNVRFMATGNDEGNVTVLDSASLTRFALYTVSPDADEVLKHFASAVDPAIKTVLDEHPDWIVCDPISQGIVVGTTDDKDDADDDAAASYRAVFGEEQDMAQFTTPRTIEGLNEWLANSDENALRRMSAEDTLTHPRTGKPCSPLQLSLLAMTGDTSFTAAVYQKLFERLHRSVGNPNAAAALGPVIPRPVSWDTVRTVASRTDIAQLVTGLDAGAQEELLLYSLVANEERGRLDAVIDGIFQDGKLTGLTDGAISKLINAKAAGQLNDLSRDKFFGYVNSPLIASLGQIKGYLGANS